MENILRYTGEFRCVAYQFGTCVVVHDLLFNWIGYFVVEELIVASCVQHLFT